MIEKVKILKSNCHYRIGDIVFRQGFRWADDTESILLSPKYRKSILFKYLNHFDHPSLDPFKNVELPHPRGILNINVLRNCVNMDCNPKNDTLYVTIRCGDIVQLPAEDRSNFWLFNKDSLISCIKNKLKKSQISKVEFVCTMHFGDFKEKKLFLYSEKDVNENINLLNNIFLNVKKIIDCDIVSNKADEIENIDHHFSTLIKAKNVILDQGGFSSVVSILRSPFLT
jgi:hypothetical protein